MTSAEQTRVSVPVDFESCHQDISSEREISQMTLEHVRHLTREECSRVLWRNLVAKSKLSHEGDFGVSLLLPNLVTAVAVEGVMMKD